ADGGAAELERRDALRDLRDQVRLPEARDPDRRGRATLEHERSASVEPLAVRAADPHAGELVVRHLEGDPLLVADPVEPQRPRKVGEVIAPRGCALPELWLAEEWLDRVDALGRDEQEDRLVLGQEHVVALEPISSGSKGGPLASSSRTPGSVPSLSGRTTPMT